GAGGPARRQQPHRGGGQRQVLARLDGRPAALGAAAALQVLVAEGDLEEGDGPPTGGEQVGAGLLADVEGVVAGGPYDVFQAGAVGLAERAGLDEGQQGGAVEGELVVVEELGGVDQLGDVGAGVDGLEAGLGAAAHLQVGVGEGGPQGRDGLPADRDDVG